MDAAAANPLVHRLAIAHNHDLRGATKQRMHDEHEPRMKTRHAIAEWIVEQQLLGDAGWHADGGPPLATPYAPAVEALKLHTRDGLLALRHDDASALMARPELVAIEDASHRERLAVAIARAVAKATNRDEL